ncbi:hypothetical protein KUCAC02_018692, partial [Chaenocephalus aceratus]
NNTYSVGTEPRCKSNWFHWKVDKKQWLVAEDFLPSLTAPGLITGPLRLEAVPVGSGPQPPEPSAAGTTGDITWSFRRRKREQSDISEVQASEQAERLFHSSRFCGYHKESWLKSVLEGNKDPGLNGPLCARRGSAAQNVEMDGDAHRGGQPAVFRPPGGGGFTEARGGQLAPSQDVAHNH